MAPYLAFFAAGRFRIDKGVRDGQPWLVAVSKALPTAAQPRAMRLMRQTPTITRWLEGQLGDYPFSTVGGLVTSLEPRLRAGEPDPPDVLTGQPDRDHGRARARAPVVRRLGVRAATGATSGSTRVLRRSWSGAGTRPTAGVGGDSRLRQRLRHADADDEFWDQQVADPCPTYLNCVNRIFDRRVYERGAMALQALRNRVGEADFSALLRPWVADRKGGNGSTADFQALAEEISGEDLDGFFTAWLHATTKPADTVANGLG